MDIDRPGVDSRRGFSYQDYIATYLVYRMIQFNGTIIKSVITEGLEDIEIYGQDFRFLYQSKKKDDVGQWQPDKIIEIAFNMFLKWFPKARNFNISTCKDQFFIILEGDISPKIFNKEESESCIIPLEKISYIQPKNTLSENSNLKSKIELKINQWNEEQEHDEKIKYEKNKLNYFISSLRICCKLPPLEELKDIIYTKTKKIISLKTSISGDNFHQELFDEILKKLNESGTSYDENCHIIKYEEISLSYFEIQDKYLSKYIRDLSRKDEKHQTSLEKKIIDANGNNNIYLYARSAKITWIQHILDNSINLYHLEGFYRKYIDWMNQKWNNQIVKNLDQIHFEFFNEKKDLFLYCQIPSDMNLLKGLFYDIVSYCPFKLEGINHD